MLRILSSIKNVLANEIKQILINQQAGALIHTTATVNANLTGNRGPRKFVDYNKKIFEPTAVDEPPRNAFVCHVKKDIKYSPKKMWYLASFIRGMTIDEAIKQLNFNQKKGSMYIKQALLEAQDLAVKQHNVEFKSNLWVAESFTGKGMVIKGARRHAKARYGKVEYKFCHYFVRLEEGNPPENYYLPHPLTPERQLDKWIADMRKRKVINSL